MHLNKSLALVSIVSLMLGSIALPTFADSYSQYNEQHITQGLGRTEALQLAETQRQEWLRQRQEWQRQEWERQRRRQERQRQEWQREHY